MRVVKTNITRSEYLLLVSVLLTLPLVGQTDYSILHIYRIKEFPPIGHVSLYINDTLRLQLSSKRKDTLHIAPGYSELKISKKGVIKKVFEPGENYYYKIYSKYSFNPFSLYSAYEIIEVTKEFGENEILNKNIKKRGIKKGAYFDKYGPRRKQIPQKKGKIK